MTAQSVSFIRAGIIFLGVLFKAGVIPTAVDGGGDKVFDGLLMVAAAIPAGNKNDPQPTVISTPAGQVTAIVTPPPPAG